MGLVSLKEKENLGEQMIIWKPGRRPLLGTECTKSRSWTSDLHDYEK